MPLPENDCGKWCNGPKAWYVMTDLRTNFHNPRRFPLPILALERRGESLEAETLIAGRARVKNG
jgi:hypothetical protein